MDSEYTLDFVLLMGPTGPTGASSASNMCFVDFLDGTTNGVLTVNRQYISPSATSSLLLLKMGLRP